jgi:hypothetical protein
MLFRTRVCSNVRRYGYPVALSTTSDYRGNGTAVSCRPGWGLERALLAILVRNNLDQVTAARYAPGSFKADCVVIVPWLAEPDSI